MRVIIIEDEPTLASVLASILRQVRPDVEIKAVVPDTVSAIDAIRSNPDINLIFADIRLEDGYSFDVFDAVDTDAMIIFTTAYDEYALKAFDYDCIDYILKPYRKEDLEDALRRFEKRMPHTGVADSRRIADHALGRGKEFRSRIMLDRVSSTLIVDVNDICYAEYDLGSVHVYCRNKVSGTTNLSLTNLAAELDPDIFMKVSRVHIVNVKEVAAIQPTLRRSKIISLRSPYEDARVEVTAEMLRELKRKMDLG